MILTMMSSWSSSGTQVNSSLWGATVGGSKFCSLFLRGGCRQGLEWAFLFGNLRQVTVCVTGEEHGRATGICPDKAISQGRLLPPCAWWVWPHRRGQTVVTTMMNVIGVSCVNRLKLEQRWAGGFGPIGDDLVFRGSTHGGKEKKIV